MRTSNCKENNEEVNGHLQSEPNDQEENVDNSTSSSKLSILKLKLSESEGNQADSSFEYPTYIKESCSGCNCRAIEPIFDSPDKVYCHCDHFKNCCRPKGDKISPLCHGIKNKDNQDFVFDLLKKSEPLRTVSIKSVKRKIPQDSDSDVEIVNETSTVKQPSSGLYNFFKEELKLERNEHPKTYTSLSNHSRLGLKLLAKLTAKAKFAISTTTTTSRNKRLCTVKEPAIVPPSLESLKKGKKRKSSENEDPVTTKYSRTEFIDCGSSTNQIEEEYPKPCSSTSDYKSPLSTKNTNNIKRKKESVSNIDSDLLNMSMYEYRLTDPQLPSSTSYYTSSAKSSAVATEEQQNTTNASTQNLLDSNKTIATLCNIGNSCYLNSVVYTLRFAPLFLHKLHHLIEDMATIYIKLNPTKHKSSSLGRNVSLWQGHSGRSWSSKDLASLGSITGTDSLPKNNRLIVTEKLHELYQNLHKNESSLNTEPFHAGTFLQAIQDVCSIFEGNQQQDAHECLMCILDSIRETCDTLATAIIENPEQLLAEYGLGSLIEESRTSDETLQQQSMQQIVQQHNTQQSSSSSSGKGFTKFLSRKSKRKKSDDESTVAGPASTSPINADNKPPESPSKDRVGDSTTSTTTGQSEIMNNHEESGDGSSAATSPTSTVDTKLNMKNAILKALAGEHDVNDKQKLKENVCKLLGLNFFCEDFEGVTVSSIKCLTCEQVKTLKEKMIDISVPITGHENAESMSNAQSFFQNSCITKENFRGENKYRCENCFGYTEAIRSITYEILPRLLVIHLKRFSGGMEKINSYIPTPLTLKCFCNSCINLPDEEKLHIYKLYSVITHVGATMSVGHYVAYTCALDIQNEYRTCTNDRTKITSLFQNNTNGSNNNNSDTNASSQSGSNPSLSSSNATNGDKYSGPKSIKRFFFGNRKANSSNDLKSNSFKSNVNGLVTKVVANGMEKLNLGINNTTGRVLTSNGTTASICQGQKCCGIKENKLVSNNNGTFISYVNGTATHMNGGSMNGSHPEMDTLAPPLQSSSSSTKPSSSDLSIASSTNSTGAHNQIEDDSTVTSTTTTSAGKVNTHQVNNITQDHWYMCDDDKIKVMQQQQFEEHLSPTKKNMITPYLLFYARFDAHPL